MSEKLVLLGVKHLLRNLPKVESYLSKFPLRDKKVLTEFDESANKSSHEFYGPLQDFLLSQGAVLLHEEGERKLSVKAMNEYESIYGEKNKLEWESLVSLEEDAKQRNDMSARLRIAEAQGRMMLAHQDDFLSLNSKYRNPNILDLISSQRPDFVVIGNGHIRELYPSILRNTRDRQLEYKVFD